MRLQMPIGQMEALFQMAYFREAREVQDLDLNTISELFGKSLRTVSSLHRRFRGDFFSPEQEAEFMLDVAERLNRKPSTFAELTAAFEDRNQYELENALRDLMKDKHILLIEGVYRRNPAEMDYFSESDTVRRIHSLNRQMDIVAETVWQRFLSDEEASSEAMERSFLFSADAADYVELKKDLMEWLTQRLIAIDAKAQEAGVDNRLGLVFSVAELEESE